MKNYGYSDCERGGCDDEARRLNISAVIYDGGVTKSACPPRHQMDRSSLSSDSKIFSRIEQLQIAPILARSLSRQRPPVDGARNRRSRVKGLATHLESPKAASGIQNSRLHIPAVTSLFEPVTRRRPRRNL